MKSFKTLIEEKDKVTTVLVITEQNFELNKNGKHYTVNRIEEECKKMNLNCHVVFIDSYYIDEQKNNFINMKTYDIDDNEKKIKFDSHTTIAIIRGNILNNDYGVSICKFLNKNNIPLYNTPEIIELCTNKYLTYLKLKYDIEMPRTELVTHEKSIPDAIIGVGGKFPVIVKTLTGAEGVGITKADSVDTLKALLQAFWKLEAKLLIQEYIENDYDVRTIMINGKIIASMKRVVPKDDFRSNKSIGGKTIKYKLDEKEIAFVNKVYENIGGNFLGIDFMKKGNKIYLIEINSSPGTEGIEEASGKNIVEILLGELT